MSFYYPPKNVPPAYSVEYIRKLATAIGLVMRGKQEITGSVTLTASATSTLVTDARCSAESVVFLMPLTSNAAAAVATTYITTANITNGQFRISHANNAQVDRSFRYVILG